MIPCYYMKSKPNFGDMLAPIIMKFVSGQNIIYVSGNAEKKLLCVGTGLNCWLRSGDLVWGYGSRNTDVHGKIHVPEGVKFLAVRGQMTRESILADNPGAEVPEVYGDPGILMPMIYAPAVKKEFGVGLIPHYIDKVRFGRYSKDTKVIDVFSNPFKVIDDMNRCEVIISTSMHGVIVAESYGIPAVWLQVSNRILGCQFKFNDYFSGSGRGYTGPVQRMTGEITEKDLWGMRKSRLPDPTFEKEKLLNAWYGAAGEIESRGWNEGEE